MNDHIFKEDAHGFIHDEALIVRAHGLRERMITQGQITPVEARHHKPVLRLDDAGRAAAARHIVEGQAFSPFNLPHFSEVA